MVARFIGRFYFFFLGGGQFDSSWHRGTRGLFDEVLSLGCCDAVGIILLPRFVGGERR